MDKKSIFLNKNFVKTFALCFLGLTFSINAQTTQLDQDTIAWIKQASEAENSKVIAWRQDIHQHPELGNFEFRTAKLVANHLQNLGLSVETGIAKTGVIGILKGDKPGPVIALRADMDALPIKEETGLPFASQLTGVYFGKTVDVMHACGHDNHVAMLMGAAEILAKNKDKIAGTIIFIFQPAEEGTADIDDFSPNKQHHGARKIIDEGILDKYKVEAVFGIHVQARRPTGEYGYKANAILSSIDDFHIKVKGAGTHASAPWTGSDAIYASAKIIDGAQSIISRRSDLISGFGVLSFGSIHGGQASNVIPNEVEMNGTIRTVSPSVRNTILAEFPELVKDIAKAYHTEAEVFVADIYPVTANDPKLTAAMIPILSQVNDNQVKEMDTPISAGEDFSYYAEKVPGLFIFLGVSNADNGKDISQVAGEHSSTMMVDERALKHGVMAHIAFALGYPKVKID